MKNIKVTKMEERLKQIQTKFKGIRGYINLHVSGGIIFNYIDVDSNILNGISTHEYFSSTGGNFESKLNLEVDYMNESEFQDLIDELTRLKKI
jgi:hypothetical protein